MQIGATAGRCVRVYAAVKEFAAVRSEEQVAQDQGGPCGTMRKIANRMRKERAKVAENQLKKREAAGAGSVSVFLLRNRWMRVALAATGRAMMRLQMKAAMKNKAVIDSESSWNAERVGIEKGGALNRSNECSQEKRGRPSVQREEIEGGR